MEPIPEKNNHESPRIEQFLRLMTASHDRIYAFILSIVPNWTDADDLMQETIMVMWRKFDKYKPGTSFVSWGMQIAKYEIINFCKKRGKRREWSRDDVNQCIMDQAESVNVEINERLNALKLCISKLDQYSRKLVKLRYEQNVTVKNIADVYGKTVQSMYKALGKIHDVLMRCIRKTMLERGLG